MGYEAARPHQEACTSGRGRRLGFHTPQLFDVDGWGRPSLPQADDEATLGPRRSDPRSARRLRQPDGPFDPGGCSAWPTAIPPPPRDQLRELGIETFGG